MKTRINSPNLVRILFIVALVIPLAMGGFSPARTSYVYAAEPQTGIDCGCGAYGPYVDPIEPDGLTLTPATSPGGKYTVSTVYQFETLSYLGVMLNGVEIVSETGLPSNASWGFSPDEDRFAVYYIRNTLSGPQSIYHLYNLVGTNRRVPVWEGSASGQDTEGVFSPHGLYFQYAAAGATSTWLEIVDAKTGDRVYGTSFNASAPPGDRKARIASWGYSPDTSDRTFVYAYVSSQVVSSVSWNLVNLAAEQLVRNEMLVNANTYQGIGPFWKFSRCGDAIALVNTGVAPTNIRLFATHDGVPLNAGGLDITATASIALANNLTTHYVTTESGNTALANNTADAACAAAPGLPALSSLTLNAASVLAGGVVQGTVTLNLAAPSGGVTIHLESDAGAAHVPASVTVASGFRVATFSITTTEVNEETTALISAMLGSTTNTAELTIIPPALTSLTLDRYAIVAGDAVSATVTLRDPAPAGGAVVWLYPYGYFHTLTLVLVPEGETSVSFDVTADLNVMDPNGTLSATYAGAEKSVNLTILRPSSVTATPAEVTGGRDAVVVTVGFSDPAPEGGIAVPLTADPAGIVDFPPSMIIETGQITGSITASTAVIDEDADVTVKAGVPEDTESPTAVVHVLATIPTALPGGPYVVLAGQSVSLIGTGRDPRGESLTFAWDLDGDETFETAGATTILTDTAGQNRDIPVWFRACNTSGLCGTALTFVRVRNPGQVWVSGSEPWQDIGMPNNEIGIPDGPTPALVEGFGEVIDVVGSENLVVALRADGSVWTMGNNFYGQLGDPSLPTGWLPDGHRAASSVPVTATISDVVAIASSGEHVMALKRDGTVWTWGSNRYLQLGNGAADWNPHPTPRQVENLSGVVAIAASHYTSFAMTRKGEIYGWGYGVQVFGIACRHTASPCRITTIRQAVALQVTSDWAIVLKRDGTVWFWGDVDPVTMKDRLDAEQIEGLSGITAISASDGSFSGYGGATTVSDGALLALKNDGTVWGFGNNYNGQLGEDPLIPYPPYLDDYIGPVQVPGLAGIQALAAGRALQAALLQDGTVAGWGLVMHNCPDGCGEYWLPSPLAGLVNVKAVAVGDDFRLAIVPGGVPGAPGLAITQIADLETVSSGDPVSFTITITNNGDGTASSVTLTDTLPTDAGLAWSVGGTDGGSCTITAGVVSCNFGDMPPGAVKTIKLTSPTPNDHTFCSTISSAATVMADNQPEGRSATASTKVLCLHIYISVWADTLGVVAGDPVSYTVTVGNTGEDIARNVDSEVGLPNNPGLSWSISNVTPASAAGNCTIDTSGTYPVLLCSFDQMALQEVAITITSPTSSGSCGTLESGGTVTSSNGGAGKAKSAFITINCTVSDTVQPGEAATLTLPDGRGQVEFPADLVTVPTTFTYTAQDAPSQALGSYTFAGLSFTLDATDPAGNPVTSFPANYTIRLNYQDSDWQSAGIADENRLNLAYWDTVNGQWVNVLPCEGCSLDTEQNHLVAMLNHLTEFALLASTDTTPPTTSASLSPQANASGWHAGPVAVALTASDSESGVHSTEYNLNGAGWTTYNAPFEVSSGSANNTVQYRSTDDAGNVEEAKSLTIQIDTTAPTTSASISPEASASGWHAGRVTVTLTASDSGSGVHNTEYNLNGAGWTTYSAPFDVSSESASNTVQYRSTDEAGNVEETKSLTIQIDTTAPTVGASVPLSGSAVQGGIKFGVSLADALSGPAGATLSIREADGASGKEIGYENLAAVYNSTSGNWELAQPFDTTQLPDGFYVLVATGKDVAGNEKTEIIPFSVRNWAVLELLPSTENNKAGRTMPVKFSLRVVQEVDPAQPFVYSEELTITIYEAGQPTPVLQSSTFGSGARNYRINAAQQTYITNFQTLKSPMQYTVAILRDALLIGTFGFQTTK